MIDEKRKEQLRKAQAKRREKRKEEGKVMLEIPIDPQLREALKALAEKEGITLIQLVEKILKEGTRWTRLE